MKSLQVVFINRGENCGTYSPLCWLSSFTGDIDEMCTRCRNYDDDGLVQTNLYAIREISMPEFMSEAQYLNDYISMTFAASYHADILNWSETAFYNYLSLDNTYQFFIGWLLTKYANTKSAYMTSIKAQVNSWLNTNAPAYKTPLSYKQFDIAAKYCPLYEADKISNRTYYAMH